MNNKNRLRRVAKIGLDIGLQSRDPNLLHTFGKLSSLLGAHRHPNTARNLNRARLLAQASERISRAITDHDDWTFRALVELFGPNIHDSLYNEPIIFLVTIHGTVSMLDILLRAKVDLGVKIKNLKSTPLEFLLSTGFIARGEEKTIKAEKLIKAGAPIRKVVFEDLGRVYIDYFSQENHVKWIERIFRALERRGDFPFPWKWRLQGIVRSIACDFKDRISDLDEALRMGADPNVVDGAKPIIETMISMFEACGPGDTLFEVRDLVAKAFRVFLKYKARVRAELWAELLNPSAPYKYGLTMPLVQGLVDAGAPIDKKITVHGRTGTPFQLFMWSTIKHKDELKGVVEYRVINTLINTIMSFLHRGADVASVMPWAITSDTPNSIASLLVIQLVHAKKMTPALAKTMRWSTTSNNIRATLKRYYSSSNNNSNNQSSSKRRR